MTQPSPSLEAMVALVRNGRFEQFVAQAAELDPADLADVLALLDDTERLEVVRLLPPEVSASALVIITTVARLMGRNARPPAE